MRKHINSALKILIKIFSEKTYSNMAIGSENASDMSRLLVLGVLDENVKIEYILSSLVSKKPQNTVYILLKIGTYALLNLKDVPTFAIVSECVEVTKMNGKSGASGFVNAVLKKVAKGEYSLPKESDENYLSVKFSKPQWFVEKLVKQYGKDVATEIMSADVSDKEHIRVNSRLTSLEEVEIRLKREGVKFERSEVGGLVLKAEKPVSKLFKEGLVTYQSPSSMIAVLALGVKDGGQILDLCSAPGGKAIYLSELARNSNVTACDIHPHRVKLIESYKERMKADNVNAELLDATKFKKEWEKKFDFVLLDAPCSCFGTFRKHPDVFLSRDESDIKSIAETQKQILKNAVRYLKNGGKLVYSTCTLFDEENRQVVESVLDSKEYRLEKIAFENDVLNEKFKDNDGTATLLPKGQYDGFFISKIVRSQND